ncbi:MAG: ABC transporter permease [Clostridiales bacterium]|nr:ABC transporter permease [Clostridiales bacterium]
MSNQNKRKIILEKRLQTPKWIGLLVTVVSVFAALIFSSVFLQMTGQNPFEVYRVMFKSAFGSSYGFSETLVKAIPLMMASFGIAMAFKMVIWNIGAEGQLLLGALAASVIALSFPNLPSIPLIVLMMIAAMIAGGLWALIPGLAKSYWNVNEVITSLMLNYVAINIIDYFVYGPLKNPYGSNFPETETFVRNAWLPTFASTRVHLGIIFALLTAIILYFVLNKTRWGYEVKVIGESRNVARYSGMDIKKNIILVMMVSGALAGLGGMTEVSGVVHKLDPHLSIGLGYSAIIVAWLSKLNPFVIVVVSILFGGLINGGFSIQMHGIPAATATMLQGAILFFVLGGDIFARYKIRIIK